MPTKNRYKNKRRPFALRKTVFCIAKGHVSQPNMPPFTSSDLQLTLNDIFQARSIVMSLPSYPLTITFIIANTT